jgi:hypothetical protein
LGPVTLDELKAAFPEFSGERCRFSNCTHREEPGCAIREAGGTRYDAWLRRCCVMPPENEAGLNRLFPSRLLKSGQRDVWLSDKRLWGHHGM